MRLVKGPSTPLAFFGIPHALPLENQPPRPLLQGARRLPLPPAPCPSPRPWSRTILSPPATAKVRQNRGLPASRGATLFKKERPCCRPPLILRVSCPPATLPPRLPATSAPDVAAPC